MNSLFFLLKTSASFNPDFAKARQNDVAITLEAPIINADFLSSEEMYVMSLLIEEELVLCLEQVEILAFNDTLF